MNTLKMNTDITTILPESPDKNSNLERFGDHSNSCICCGKRIKSPTKYVHMNTDWMVVRADIEDIECEAITGAPSQGAFPIGNDCAKKLNKNYLS